MLLHLLHTMTAQKAVFALRCLAHDGSDANHGNNQKILLSQLDGTSHNDISHPLLYLRRRNQNYHSSTPEVAKDMREVYYFPFLLQSSLHKVTHVAIFCSCSRRTVVTLCRFQKRDFDLN